MVPDDRDFLDSQNDYELDWVCTFGEKGKPIFPSWWYALVADLSLDLEFRHKNQSGTKKVSIGRLIRNPDILTLSKYQDLKLSSIADDFGKIIETTREEILETKLGKPSFDYSQEIILLNLPLHISTHNEIRYQEFAKYPLANAANLSLRFLRQAGISWFSILDLAMAMSHSRLIFGNKFETWKSQSLEEYSSSLVYEYIMRDGLKIGPEWIGFIKSRYGLGCESKTLEEIGKEAGEITRERVRQILSRVIDRAISIFWPLPTKLDQLIDRVSLVTEPKDAKALLEEINDLESGWNSGSISVLLELSGHRHSAKRFEKFLNLSAKVPKLDPGLRSHRNKIGFFNLENFISESGDLLSSEQTWELVESTYSRSFRSGNWALVGEMERTMAETAVAKQLGISQNLTFDEIYEGINRVRRNRSYPHLPPKNIVADLLVKSGCLQLVEGRCMGEGLEVDGEAKNWVVDYLKSCPGQVANANVITREAVASGLNSSTIQVYLTYDPLLRKIGGGLVSLVGSKPTKEEKESASRIANILNVSEIFNYSLSGNHIIELKLVVGTKFFTNGVLNPPVALRTILSDIPLGIECCDNAIFAGTLKVTQSFWYGFSPVAYHLQREHNLHEGDQIMLSLDLDNRKALFLTNH